MKWNPKLKYSTHNLIFDMHYTVPYPSVKCSVSTTFGDGASQETHWLKYINLLSWLTHLIQITSSPMTLLQKLESGKNREVFRIPSFEKQLAILCFCYSLFTIDLVITWARGWRLKQGSGGGGPEGAEHWEKGVRIIGCKYQHCT